LKLTDEEKNILIGIVIAAIAGLIINIFFSYGNKIRVNETVSAPLLININTASVEELDRLPGVGKVTADRIVKLRASNGLFASADDLKKVKGMTVKKIEKMRKYITTEAAK
jgi:competence ComEA-like helix-hairpin-helix protein